MKLVEQGSEVEFGRYTTSQIPKYRDTNPRTLPAGGICQPIRRKHIAEPYGSGDQVGATDHEYNETSLPFRQRTNSATPIENIRLRPTSAKLKNDTDVVTTQKSDSSHNSSPSPTCSPIKHTAKQKTSSQSIHTQPDTPSSSSLSFSTADAKGPQKKKIKKGGSGPVPKQLPTIFNVGRSSPLSALISLPSTASDTITTRSAFALDATLWDMDTLPLIPSPPKTPPPQNNTTTTIISSASFPYSASSDAPFSTPYDEDALLENEIPFPLNKHSNVIIENMGVKKAKNLYKGKESLLNRHITTVRPELPPYSDSTLPLPIRSLCQSKEALNPSTVIPFQDTFSRPIISEISAGHSSSRQDAWGCMHLGADDYELSIAFPETSHYEVWDMDDDAVFACPAFLCLMAKDPRIWTGTPISLPDVSLIDIRCDDHPIPSSMSVYDPSIEYGTQCIVPRKNAWNRKPPPSSQMPGSPCVVDPKEITIDGKWEKTFTKPEVEGQSQTRILHIGGRNGDAHETTGRGWYLKIWIPIPARLFMKRETRIFQIRASVWMAGDKEYILRTVDLEEVEEEDLPLAAEAEMTVSHLRREREMIMTMN